MAARRTTGFFSGVVLSLPSVHPLAGEAWRLPSLYLGKCLRKSRGSHAPDEAGPIVSLTIAFSYCAILSSSGFQTFTAKLLCSSTGAEAEEAKAQSGQGLTGPGSRFCRCWSPKSRHLWPPDVLGDPILPDAEEVTTCPLPRI